MLADKSNRVALLDLAQLQNIRTTTVTTSTSTTTTTKIEIQKNHNG